MRRMLFCITFIEPQDASHGELKQPSPQCVRVHWSAVTSEEPVGRRACGPAVEGVNGDVRVRLAAHAHLLARAQGRTPIPSSP